MSEPDVKIQWTGGVPMGRLIEVAEDNSHKPVIRRMLAESVRKHLKHIEREEPQSD